MKMGAWLEHTLAKLFVGLLACLLLASGANAATVETTAVSAQSKAAAGSAVTRNCGATATSRIKPLVMVVTYGLTWRDLNGVLDGKNSERRWCRNTKICAIYSWISSYTNEPANS